MTRVFASLRFRLVFLVLLAVVPAIGVVIYSATEQRRLVQLRTQENAVQVAASAARVQEQLVESTRQFLTVVAQFPSVRGSDLQACNELMAVLSTRNPQFSDLLVSNPQGDLLCGFPLVTIPMNISDDSFVPHVIEARDFAVGEYRATGRSSEPVLGFGYPLIDESGRPQGIVIASFRVTTLNRLALDTPMPQGSTLTIRDRKGVVVARYPDPENWIGKTIPDAPGIGWAVGAQADTAVEATGTDGVPRLYAQSMVRSVPINDLSVTVGIPTSVAYADVNKVLEHNLLFLGLIGTIALAAAWLGGDWFLFRHVNALAEVTRRMADGDLTARTGLVDGVGELSQLARSFDRMVQAVEQRQTALTQAEDRVRRWASHLEGLINAVADASSQPFDASKIVEIALSRTVGVMNLDGGCVVLKCGDGWALAVHHGLDSTIVETIQQLAPSAPAAQAINRWASANTVQSLEHHNVPPALVSFATAFPTWISVPIKSKGHVYGLVFLIGASRVLPDAEEQRVLGAVGRQLGVAIENAELYGQVRSMAALKERERLGRELHDGLAQVLGYLAIKNKLATDLVTRGQLERAALELQDMQQTMESSCQDIRESILGLRVTVAPNGGLMTALQEYARKYSHQTGIRLSLCSTENHLVFPPDTEVQLLRIIQEALGNIRKHSAAPEGSIRFERHGNLSVIAIEDLGKGFDPAQVGADGLPHYGLQTMRERAESVGGTLQILSRPGQGTRVVVTLPLRENM